MPRDGSATRARILDVAERLVIDNGYAATSVEQVIAESRSSKGAFFHHFPSKAALARALVDRYAASDVAHLHLALDHARAQATTPVGRLLAFLQFFEDGADDLMSAQSSCLYVAVLTERQLAQADTTEQIRAAVVDWRVEVAALVRAALASATGPADGGDVDVDAVADHVFVTFEGAFILCRTTGDAGHMRRQLAVLRRLVAALCGV